MPLPGTTLSADFNADQMTGLAGCNSYFGPYATDGDGFSAGPLGATRRFCDPAAIMEQESNFLGLLATADRWERDGDQLKLFEGDAPLVQFALAEPTELAGTSWTLLFNNNQRGGLESVIIDSEITMVFEADTVSGSAGCNSYDADYTAGADTLEFGPARTTRMFCDQPAGIMEQETTFLSNLDMVATYGVTADGVLEMFDAEGMRLLQLASAS
jgi:heat shock protein HslJ